MKLGTIEPPRPCDLTPITRDELEAMLVELGREEMSDAAKLSIATEWIGRCRDVGEASQEHIASALGLTKSRVEQIESEAKRKAGSKYPKEYGVVQARMGSAKIGLKKGTDEYRARHNLYEEKRRAKRRAEEAAAAERRAKHARDNVARDRACVDEYRRRQAEKAAQVGGVL